MRSKRTLALAAAALLLIAPAARASGFMIYEHGAAAMAMAGAFTSLAKDPSALWHNPAGLAWLEGTQVMAGATFIFPSGTVDFPTYPGAPSYDQEHQIFTPPNIYLTHRLSDQVAVGLGVFAPYGLGISWPDPETFPWRYLGTSSEMQTIFINPALAVKITDRFSLALGVSFITSQLTQSLTELRDIGEVPVEADLNGTSFGFNAGLLYKGEGYRFGLSYRSRFNLEYTGTISLKIMRVPPEPVEGTGETTFKFPDIVTMGLSFDLTKKLIWAVDLHYIFWGSYDGYTIHSEVPGLGLSEDLHVPTLWRDSYIARTGLEYMASDKLALRAGFAYDKTPQPAATMDSSLPDADRIALTAGFGYSFGKLKLDLACQYEDFKERTSARKDVFQAIPGTFKTRALLLGVNLGYRF